MRIIGVREIAVPLTANIRNSLVDFSRYNVSLVAVISDQMKNGKPVAGLAFNSIGRFAQSGLLRERFIPRLMEADADALLDKGDGLFDPARVERVVLRDEKPGGHGDRAGAVAALELAVWDLNAKLRDEPAYRSIARAGGRDASLRRSGLSAVQDERSEARHARRICSGSTRRSPRSVIPPCWR